MLADVKVKEKIVIVKRVYKDTRLPEDILEASKMRFGPAVKNDVLVMPISAEDATGIRIYAELCNSTPGQHGFREAINEYLNSVRVNVPHEGLFLNIATHDDGMPIEPRDYLYHQIALTNIKTNTGIVHNTEFEAMTHPLGQFYLEDVNKKKREQVQSVDDKADALIAMKVMVNESPEKVDWILSYFGRNPFPMTAADKKIALNDIIEGKSTGDFTTKTKGFGELRYKDRPAKFFEIICADKNLEYRSMIELLEFHKVVTTSGGKYFFDEIELGMGIDDVVKRLSGTSADSKKILLQLKARYDEVKRELAGKSE